MSTRRNLKRNQRGVIGKALQKIQRRTTNLKRTPKNHRPHHPHLMKNVIHLHRAGPRAHRGAADPQEEVGDHLGHPEEMGTHRVTPLRADQVLANPLLREVDPQEEAEALHRAVARESLKPIQNLMMDWHHPDILHGPQ